MRDTRGRGHMDLRRPRNRCPLPCSTCRLRRAFANACALASTRAVASIVHTVEHPHIACRAVPVEVGHLDVRRLHLTSAAAHDGYCGFLVA
jgi:hypothetical protein